MLLPEDYPRRIRSLRRELDLSQAEFAELFPVSYVTVSRWENARCEPTPMAWLRIKQMESKLGRRKTKTGLPPGIHTFLDASTAHITPADDTIIQAWSDMEKDLTRAAPYRTISHSYGYFIHVRHDDIAEAVAAAKDDGISDAFFALQNYARQHGCWWINLDRDADTIEGLPAHDW